MPTGMHLLSGKVTLSHWFAKVPLPSGVAFVRRHIAAKGLGDGQAPLYSSVPPLGFRWKATLADRRRGDGAERVPGSGHPLKRHIESQPQACFLQVFSMRTTVSSH